MIVLEVGRVVTVITAEKLRSTCARTVVCLRKITVIIRSGNTNSPLQRYGTQILQSARTAWRNAEHRTRAITRACCMIVRLGKRRVLRPMSRSVLVEPP